MDFKDAIYNLSDKVSKLKDQIKTEEATKNALIMPFLQALGYDVFNPLEVEPEYVADVGTKKGEKVDYAIVKNGEPVILIECKWWGENLADETYWTQLFRYFSVTKSKFAILTNGIRFQFFSDLDEENKMDERPFLDFDITDLNDMVISELKKFHKSYFDIDKISDTAMELMLASEVKRVLQENFKNPSQDFVKLFIKQIYKGKATEKVINQFTGIVKKTVHNLLSEMVNDRIKAALEKEDGEKEEVRIKKESEPDEEKEIEDEKKIITTEIEIEGYYIVKTILRNKGFDISRISYKDTLSYFAILIDGSTHKTVCRLWLNSKKKYIGLFDKDRNETRHVIKTLDDIFQYENELIETFKNYDL